MTKFPDELTPVIAMLKAGQDARPENPTIEEMRSSYDAISSAMPVARGVEIEAAALGGVIGLKMTPGDAVAGRTLLYFHGGGYVIGSPETHKSMVSELAAAMKAVTYSMDYRMAPEAPFPAAVDDGLACYKALLDAGVAPDQIIISGDSAGGGLTMATAISIRDAGLPLPAGLVPISPWVNLANDGPAYKTKAEADPMVQKEGIDGMAALYLNGTDAKDPLASPLGADLSGLPPMLIQVGSEEVLLSDATMLAARAGAAQVAVTLEVWPGMFHVFQFFHPMLTDARSAIAGIGRWVDDVMG